LLIALLAGCAPPTSLVVEGHSCTYREEPTLVGEKLGTIQFGHDSDALDSQARTTLTRLAGQINQQPESLVRIEGNCDPRADRECRTKLLDYADNQRDIPGQIIYPRSDDDCRSHDGLTK